MSKLISYSEAAQILTVAEVTLRRWVSERRIPYLKIGRSVRFDIAELEAWIRKHAVLEGGKR